MTCIYCRGRMQRSTAPFHVDQNGYQLRFGAVPAWVCGQCGEAYFEKREVEAIQSAIKEHDRQVRQFGAGA